jgi:hypothetical protein
MLQPKQECWVFTDGPVAVSSSSNLVRLHNRLADSVWARLALMIQVVWALGVPAPLRRAFRWLYPGRHVHSNLEVHLLRSLAESNQNSEVRRVLKHGWRRGPCQRECRGCERFRGVGHR